MKSKIIYALLSIGILMIFYLSWVPDPKIGSLINLPPSIATWTDAPENDTIRTGVPFLGLGFIIGLYVKQKNSGFRTWALTLALLTVVAVLSELGQLFMPLRNCDFQDVLWAFLGSVTGLFFGYILGNLIIKNIKT